MFCTYLTVYVGDKLPRRYIGSSTVDRVAEGYHGSVQSKKYKDVWKSELNNNPHLFKTRILKIYESREEATQAELDLQIKYDVVRSDKYINMALARPNGFFGMEVRGRKQSEETIKKKISSMKGNKRPRQSKLMSGRVRPEQSIKMTGSNNPMYGRPHPNRGKNFMPRVTCSICGVESSKSAITRYHKSCKATS